MSRHAYLLATLLVVATACGDDGNTQPDAPDNTGCMAVTANEITSYPGTYSGTVIGGGPDFTAPMSTCTVETGGQWYDPVGEDVLIKLSDLTVGTQYLVKLTTTEDLSFYVLAGCPATAGAVTGCLSFTDETLANELGVFTATATEHYLVIDNAADPDPPTTGMFLVDVKLAQCDAAAATNACSGTTPICLDYSCVQCASAFDCGATSPVCDAANACVAGPMTCTGDDTRDTTGAGDDGPAAATTITAPVTGTPTVITGGICNSPVSEADYFKVTLPANDIGITLTFTGAANDLDVYLLDATGRAVVSGESNAGINEAIKTTGLTAGTYYVVVTQYRPTGTVAAVPYTLTLTRAECGNDYQCLTAGAPVCGAAGACGVGPALCAGDDGGEPNDDGPAGARDLTGAIGVATALTGSVCSSPATESDFYKVTVGNGEGIDLSLSWTGTGIDLDPVIFNSTGTSVGLSYYLNPETIKLTYLPAGTYYIRVNNFASMASTAVTAYTITATRTTAQTCTTNTQCASEYKTQIYRGTCVAATGACDFITTTGGANGAACDSAGDCMGARCSYVTFDADAQDSVCTTTCTSDANCTFSAGLKCTTGLQTNFCVPSCASDLECGANVGSSTLTSGQPWDYLTCTTATGVCSL